MFQRKNEFCIKGFASFVIVSALFITQAALAQVSASAAPPVGGMPAVAGPLSAKYKADAARLLKAAANDEDGYTALTYLCDHVGKRLSGSPQLNTAVEWAADLMRKAGLQNVMVQPVTVPHWVRGNESAAIMSPVAKPLHMLGLGMSVGTPPVGITAKALFVPSFAALDAMTSEQVTGKIVVFNPGWHGYEVNADYRVVGPSRAAAKGAVAVLVRSATGLVTQLPHTGTLRYDAAQPQIPAAAISAEDALLIERLAKEGPVTLHLQMDAHMESDVQAGNVMGEIVGREHPEQVVVMGGHIDSWDVGQGAQDDGSGIMATFEAVSLIHQLGLRPKRTIRLVFWVNEENGSAGAKAYRTMVGEKIGDHVAAIEMDGGAEKPLGIKYGSIFVPARNGGPATAGLPVIDLGDRSTVLPEERPSFVSLQDIVSLIGPIDAATVSPGGHGTDIEPLTSDGVPGLSPRTVGTHYFDWHHSEADTLDKVDPEDFRRNIAMLSVVAYVLADMDGRLVGQKSKPRE